MDGVFYYSLIFVSLLLLSITFFLLSDYFLDFKSIKELEDIINELEHIIKNSNNLDISDFSKKFLLQNKSRFISCRGNLSLFQLPNLIDWSYEKNQGLRFSSLITIDIDTEKNNMKNIHKIHDVHRVHDDMDSFFVFKPEDSPNYKISFLFNVTELTNIEKQKIIDLLRPLVESFFVAEYCSHKESIIFNNEIDSIFKSHYQEFLLNKKLNLIENNPIKKQAFKKQKI